MTMDKVNAVMATGFGLDNNSPTMSNAYTQTGRNGATVNWTTNEAATGQVFYDTNPILTSEATMHAQTAYVSGTPVVTDGNVHNSQAVNVQNLQPNTLYYYMTRAVDNSGNVTQTLQNNFRTTQ